MNLKLYILLLPFLLILGAKSGIDEGISFEKMKLEDALSLALKENKLVFIDAYATWCGPCKQMDKSVFSDEQVGTYFNSTFVNLKMDVDKAEGMEVKNKYKIQYLPTLLFVKPDGSVIKKAVGYQQINQLLILAKASQKEFSPDAD